jgi:hypothetical protein
MQPNKIQNHLHWHIIFGAARGRRGGRTLHILNQ